MTMCCLNSMSPAMARCSLSTAERCAWPSRLSAYVMLCTTSGMPLRSAWYTSTCNNQ